MHSNHCLAAVVKQPWCCYAWNHLLQCQHWNRVGLAGSNFVRVIWVRSVLKIIRVWLGLDHVRREIKKNTIWRCNNGCHCNICLFCEPHPLFQWYLLAASAWRATPLILCTNMHATIYFLKLAQSHAHQSIAIAGLQRVLPLQSARQRILFVACMKPLPPLQAMFLCLQAFK